MWRIWKKKSTEEFPPYPYVAAMLNCVVWFAYSLPDEPPPFPARLCSLFLSNLVCTCFFNAYTVIFCVYTSERNRVIMSIFSPITIAVVCTIGFFWKSWYGTSDRGSVAIMMRSRVTGPLGVVFGIFMYGSPLSVLRHVYETNSVEYLPFWPCLAYFLHGLVWFTYACLPPACDPYIATTNAVGAFLGLLQLGLHYKFRSRSKDSNMAVHVKRVETLYIWSQCDSVTGTEVSPHTRYERCYCWKRSVRTVGIWSLNILLGLFKLGYAACMMVNYALVYAVALVGINYHHT